MRRHTKSASISVILLAVSAGIACAQGSITQDPGNLTPGNLTFQNLGPAGPVPGPSQTQPTTNSPSTYGASGTTGRITTPGTSSTGFGVGNGAAFGGNATGTGR